MSLTVKDNGGHFDLPPEGLHIARCYAVIDLGIQVNPCYGNSSPKVLIGWELTNTKMPDGRPFGQLQRYTASLSEKSNLRFLLEGWRSKSFTPEELKGFKLKYILGATCYLTTKHSVNPQTNKKWSNVISICRLPNNIPCPPPINPTIIFDLDDYTEQTYLAVPENIRKKINLNSQMVQLSQHTALSTQYCSQPQHTHTQTSHSYSPSLVSDEYINENQDILF